MGNPIFYRTQPAHCGIVLIRGYMLGRQRLRFLGQYWVGNPTNICQHRFPRAAGRILRADCRIYAAGLGGQANVRHGAHLLHQQGAGAAVGRHQGLRGPHRAAQDAGGGARHGPLPHLTRNHPATGFAYDWTLACDGTLAAISGWTFPAGVLQCRAVLD